MHNDIVSKAKQKGEIFLPRHHTKPYMESTGCRGSLEVGQTEPHVGT